MYRLRKYREAWLITYTASKNDASDGSPEERSMGQYLPRHKPVDKWRRRCPRGMSGILSTKRALRKINCHRVNRAHPTSSSLARRNGDDGS